MPVRKFKFDSKLLGGKGGFDPGEIASVVTLEDRKFGYGAFAMMQASELHTVAVEKGEEAAWLVFEGLENPNHNPLCYSNVALDRLDLSGLYKPIDPKCVSEIVDRCLAEMV